MSSSPQKETFYFLYGSETGNCESITKRLHHDAVTEKGFPDALCMTLNEAVSKKVLDKQVSPPGDAATAAHICLVIVVSTTGEGEPPENAARFRRYLRNLKGGSLVNVRYTVLALGDTNYNNFCAAGIFIDGKLAEHGARRFYPRGEADDGIGLELVVDPWTEGIWEALAGRPPGPSAGAPNGGPAGGSNNVMPEDAGPTVLPASNSTSGAHPVAAAASASLPVPVPPPSVGNETYQAHPQRVDMAVAMETAIIYANASQICATLALFMFERVVELGGTATLYPIQYFTAEKVRHDTRIVLFVLCTDSDEHTLCEHCAKLHTLEAPLGNFGELLARTAIPSVTQLSPQGAALVKWLTDPAMRFYSSVCVAPKQESVPRATALSNRVRALATSCRLERLSKRLADTEVNTVAVSEDDVCVWAETVLDNLPGVTADASVIAASVDWFFDSRVGAAFREAYAAESGLITGLGSVTQVTRGGIGAAPIHRGGGQEKAASVDSRHSGPGVTGGNTSLNASTRAAVRQRRRNHLHYHEQFLRSETTALAANAGTASLEGDTEKEDRDSMTGGGIPSSSTAPGGSTTGLPRSQRVAPRDSKLLNEYILTPVVFLYSGGEYVSQVAHDMNAGAAVHHLRSSVADLTNFGHTGFPRRATFVFVLGGTFTKAMNRLFKTLKSLSNEGRTITGVKFAILGIDETSQNEKFNVWALELETLLLSLDAMKVHCTGLADMDNPEGLHPVLKAWSTNLWGAILHPSVSVAYLDAASPNVSAGKAPHIPVTQGHDTAQSLVHRATGGLYTSSDSPLAMRDANGDVVLASAAAAFPDSASGLSGSHIARDLLHAQQGSSSNLQRQRNTSAAAVADVALDLELAGADAGTGTLAPHPSAAGPLFPWDSVPLNRDNAQDTPLTFLYSSSGMAKTVAFHAVTSAKELGFPTSIHPFSHYDRIDFTTSPNVILFCESGPEGQSSGGKRFRKYLLNPSHKPDHFSFVRFAVLGLAPAPSSVVHPAFTWSNMLSRLQASRVFPVVIMPSLSQLHSLGLPWCECVFATLALTVPPKVLATAVQRSLPLPRLLRGNPAESVGTHAAGSATDRTTSIEGASEARGRQRPMSVLFLYGSSTGLAEAIARDFHTNALEKGYASRIAALNYYEKMNFVSTDNIVLICSTVGSNKGGYPDNAKRFARYIHRKSQPANLLKSANTRYAVLGLDNGFGEERDANGHVIRRLPGGDRADVVKVEKDNFCRPAKHLDARLGELGGRRLCRLGCVDVSMVLAEPVEEWRGELFAALRAREVERAPCCPPQDGTVGTTATGGKGPDSCCAPPAGLGAVAHGAVDGNSCAFPTSGGAAELTCEVGSSANTTALPSCCTTEGQGARPSCGSRADGKHPAFKILITHASPPISAVQGIATHLEKTLSETTPYTAVSCRPMNTLTQTEWRTDFHVVIFVIASNDDSEYPLDGSAFLRLLRQKNNPLDLFGGVQYSVLAISDNNGGGFYLGQTLDRRLEELGATRFYARGEAVDSFSLQKVVERWISGLQNALQNLQDAVCEAYPTTAATDLLEGSPHALKGNGFNDEKGTAGEDLTEDVGSPLNIAAPLLQASGLSVRDEDRPSSLYVTSPVGSRRNSVGTSEFNSPSAAYGTEIGHATSVVTNAGGVADCVNSDVCEGVLHSWTRLTSDNVEEPVILMNLAVSAETTHWEPGQTVSVMPANEVACVDALLARLATRSDEPFHPLSVAGASASSYPNSPIYATVDFPISCGTVLSRYVSLRVTRNNKSFFALLEKNATTDEERAVIKEWLARLTSAPGSTPGSTTGTTGASKAAPLDLLEVLLSLPRVVLRFRHVVEHLSILQPRVYSIASSSSANPRQLALCFKVVKHGLCTNWMYDLCQWTANHAPHRQNKVNVSSRRVAIRFSVRPRTDFRMPRDSLIPLVMVGPGTGISPFRAFLQERAEWLQRRRGGTGDEHLRDTDGATQKSVSEHLPHGVMDLYFGCRRASEDYLFADEMEQYEKDGVLNTLSVAFSREPNEGTFWYGGCYVQDRMTEAGVGLAELITQRGARVYVCGDAESMAKEVHQVLIEIVQQHLCIPKAEAMEYVDTMMKTGRYIRDVWTVGAP